MGICLWIYPLFLFSLLDTSQLSTLWDYTDFFHLKQKDDLSGSLNTIHYSYNWLIQEKDTRFDCAYMNQQIKGNLKHLANPQDRIDLELPTSFLRLKFRKPMNGLYFSSGILLGKSPGLSLGIEGSDPLASWEITGSIASKSASINHAVASDSGTIPFRWRQSDILLKVATAHAKAQVKLNMAFPTPGDSLFNNALNIQNARLDIKYLVSESYQANFLAQILHASGDFSYKKERYAKLDNLHLHWLSAGFQKENAISSWGLGVQAYHTAIGEDSYFDIWPFSAWDTFLAHRTRIKRLHIFALLPFAKLSVHNPTSTNPPLKYDASLSYFHHFAQEDIQIKNRRVVLYPFLFTYEDLDLKLIDKLDAHMDLNILLGYEISKLAICLQARQLIPLKYSTIFSQNATSPSTDTSTQRKQWGGLNISLNAALNF